jgi:hypothetical protein
MREIFPASPSGMGRLDRCSRLVGVRHGICETLMGAPSWFLSSDGECEVREAYTGPEGLIEHNSNILEARTKLFKDYADGHFMTIYGELSPELVELAKATHMEQHMKCFTFVKGLESLARPTQEAL